MEMVSETQTALNGASGEASPETTPGELPPALLEKPEGLPAAKYTLIGWDMDTTGRRLIDEICQIAAYTPAEEYSQYVMPYGELNPIARRRHNLRVVTVGRYRMLKDTTTNKVLKTKSEITALTDFLEWLEKQKGENDSIILIYHEPRRLNPIMLLEALMRHHLLDRFSAVVSGFCDNYALAADKCRDTVKSVSLRVLSRVLLDAEAPSPDGAQHRAKTAYTILQHLAQGEQAETGKDSAAELARTWARPLRTEMDALNQLKQLLERQNTFRSVFGPLLNAPRDYRRRVTQLRRHLAMAGVQFEELQAAWEQAQLDGLTKKMEELSTAAKEDEIKELVEIFDCYFDPNKEAKAFKRTNNYRNRNSSRDADAQRQNDESGGAGDSAVESQNNDDVQQTEQPIPAN